jgi:hypothetical protein
MGKITKVPNGPLIKKKGPFKGSTLKKGGVIKKAQDGFNKVKPGTKQTTPKFHVPESRFVITNDTAKVKPTRWINNPMPSDDDDNPFKVVKDVLRKKDMTNKKTGGTIKKAQEGTTLDTLYTKKNRIGNVRTNDYVGRMPSGAIEIGKVTKTSKDGKTTTTKKANQSGILGIKYTDDEIRKSMNEKKNGGPVKKAKAGAMIKRADGSMSKRGLWDNIRANKGSGKKPTKQMLVQEKKIKAKSKK